MSRFVYLFLAATLPAICAITFEPNKGQTDPRVRYLARTSTGVIFATAQEIILHREKSGKPINISFENANPQADWQPLNPTGHKIHYLVGRDTTKHINGLDSFQKLTRKNLYPGIDLVLYGNDKNQLEYDLLVAPGADPSRIRLKAPGARIDPQTGDLVIRNTTRQHKPVIFQDNKTINGRFKQIGKNSYGFEIAAYDRSKPLTIDPVIESREYIGGIGDDTITSVGPNGECAGTTTSVDFPGAPAGRRHGTDIFFRNSTTTYIMGGSGDETAAATVILNPYSTPVLGGTTNSRDLPTGNMGQVEFAGGATDGFIWTPGAAYASYIGSSGDDRIAAIVGTGSFAAVGSTTGADFPVYDDFPSRPGGGWDAFLLGGVSDNAGAFFRSMRLIGGSGDDFAHAIAQIDGGYVVAGETASPNFPLLNPIQSVRKGPTDGFVLRTTEFSIGAITLFGGSGADRISALAFDFSQLTIYAAGGTSSPTDLPGIQPQSFQKSNAGGTLDAFYTSFDSGLSRVGRSSYLGGTGSEEALAIDFDSEKRVFIAGRTSSRDFPQRTPLQNGFGGGTTDGFFAQFEPDGNASHSTYFGGSGNDEILAMAAVPRVSVANQTGINLLIAGSTTSSDLPGRAAFPTFEARRSGTQEGFIARISNDGIVLPESIVAGKDTRKFVLLSIGDNAKAATAGRATVRSSDAGRVLVAFDFFSAGSAEDTVVWNSSLPVPESLYVECLTADGEANITMSVPGYPDRVARVRCVQPELDLRVRYPLRLNAPRVQTDIVATATDPDTGIRDTSYYGVLGRRQTTEVPLISISSGTPQVVKPVSYREAIPILSIPLGELFSLEPISIGQSVLSVSAPGYKPDQKTVTVTSAAGPPSIVGIVAGFYLQQYAPYEVGLTTTSIRSTDPSKVLLMDGLSGSSPAAAITLRFPITDYRIHGLAGTPLGSEVPIEMSFNGGPWVVTRTVRFEAPVLAGTQQPR